MTNHNTPFHNIYVLQTPEAQKNLWPKYYTNLVVIIIIICWLDGHYISLNKLQIQLKKSWEIDIEHVDFHLAKQTLLEKKTG